jgi:hypothetical protein
MTPTPHADASRKIIAPGGYECWRFDASSDDGKLHLVAGLHVGHALDPQYLRRYARYRRWPTRARPPVPSEYCAVTFALLEKSRPALRFVTAARATVDDFNAADDGSSVRLGASHMNRGGGDGVLRLHLRGTYHDRTIAVNLSFRPQIRAGCDVDLAGAREVTGDGAGGAGGAGGARGARGEIGRGETARDGRTVSPSRATPMRSASVHGWVVVDPLCDVDGEISLFAAESGGPPRVTPFAGVGCHDHRFGTRPMGELGDRWLCGRALFEDRAIHFQQVGADASVVCYSDVKEPASLVKTQSDALRTSGSAMSRWGIGYPETIELRGAGEVKLMRPRVVGSSFSTVTIAYDAVGELETGRALVQVVKPRRPRWALR